MHSNQAKPVHFYVSANLVLHSVQAYNQSRDARATYYDQLPMKADTAKDLFDREQVDVDDDVLAVFLVALENLLRFVKNKRTSFFKDMKAGSV